MAEERAIVAVLAGGAGSRLGGAKALHPLLGRPLIVHPLAAAREAGLRALVIAKPDTPLPPLDEPVVREPARPLHPLVGVLAALRFAMADGGPGAIVAVGCDMPFLTGDLLGWIAALEGNAVARVGSRLQPLPARIAADAFEILTRELECEHPLRRALALLDPRELSELELARFGDPERLCFSVNDDVDADRAAAWLRSGPVAVADAGAAATRQPAPGS